jgi:hypothetical protein
VAWSEASSGCFQGTESEVLRGGGRLGESMEQIFHHLNLRIVILQGESYLKTRKKVKWLLRDFVFCAYVSHSYSPGGSI